MSTWLKKGGVPKQPVRASWPIAPLRCWATSTRAVISMFFAVTYGAMLVSFLEHMVADLSRPNLSVPLSISLMGAVLCVVLMFGMNPTYATAA